MAKNIIDLTYTINPRMMVYPGERRPIFECMGTVEQEGYHASRITVSTHTGTHIDAPMHWEQAGYGIDEVNLSRLVGEAAVVNLSVHKDKAVIDYQDFQQYEHCIKEGDIVLLNTGAHLNYGTTRFFKYPVISLKIAEFLVHKKIALFATDALSVDKINDPDMKVHHTLLGAGIPIVECLTNLNQISKERVQFIALPLKLEGLEAAQCRAVAIE